MTTDDLIRFISKNKASVVLRHMAGLPLAERRAHAKAIAGLFKATASFLRNDPDKLRIKDDDAAVVAVLATATLSELKALSIAPLPEKLAIEDVLGTLKPDWIADWVDALIAGSPFIIRRVAPIWEAGLCPRPTSDAFILGYYTYAVFHRGGIDEKALLSDDVWRFFEVEGGGEFSLASHDKYSQPPNTWDHRLLEYAKAGALDRGRLLDASLDALERDFGQFVAGWYSRFHTSLEPTPDEMAARATRYLGLLASAVPPTVSFAMKAVQALDKADAVAPDALLRALEPALQARAKGTVTTALRLVASAAKRDVSLKMDAARAATLALVSEDAGVQGKALDLIEKLGGAQNAEVRAMMADYAALVAPSVRARMAALTGSKSEVPHQVELVAKLVEAVPVASADEALALFLSVLESPRNPLDVERAMDGIAKFGAVLRAESKALSPLKKRARQVLASPGDSEVRLALAVTGCALAEGVTFDNLRRQENTNPDYEVVSKGRFARILLDRNAELVAHAIAGRALPMLSTPSDSSGCVTVDDLVAHMATYRSHGTTPGPRDLQLALLRLSKDGRKKALPNLPTETQAERAVMYALGGDVSPGEDGALWAAAWAARQPTVEDMRVANLFRPALPDCGVPAEVSLEVSRKDSDSGPYFWINIEVPTDVAEGTKTDAAIPAMFYPWQRNRVWDAHPCGDVFEDVVWASLVRPGWQEPFFRQAILSMDTDQKLTDHYCLGYLEPFFRPAIEIGPLGQAVLAFYMASEDKSVSALASEAIVDMATGKKLSSEDFAKALQPFLMCGALPTGRWTKGLAAIADAGADGFVRDVIVRLLDFTPEETPRDMGGMLELLFELHVASGTAPERVEAVDCLKAIPGGGKVAKFSKKLVQLAV